tara:strand:- start:12472 stop:12777 length:306 start_codon:yes stop_codon:yes gene_type:complete
MRAKNWRGAWNLRPLEFLSSRTSWISGWVRENLARIGVQASLSRIPDFWRMDSPFRERTIKESAGMEDAPGATADASGRVKRRRRHKNIVRVLKIEIVMDI